MRSRAEKVRFALDEFRKECKDWISYSQLADYIEAKKIIAGKNNDV